MEFKLEERDIKAVARGRFWRRWRWRYLWGLIAGCGSVVWVGALAGNLYLVIIPAACTFTWTWYMDRKANRFIKAFVERWKGEGG